jgi:hypothetical protein
MWKVKCDNVTFDVLTLDDAMKCAKNLNGFVTISDGNMEIVGKFGVDDIKDKVLPDGSSYQWTMRRDEDHKSWRKKNV